MRRVHVIGAGVAGLAAAVDLQTHGLEVAVYEAAGQAGGRCRSFHDRELDCTIDNGNHLMLSGNWAVARLLETIGSADSTAGEAEAALSFFETKTGERWRLRLGRGRIPFWLLSPGRRIPGTGLRDYASLFRVLNARRDDCLGDLISTDGRLYQAFWEPLALAVLNTEVRAASAGLLGRVLAETFLKGARFSRPLLAREGLSECFAEPAVRHIRDSGGEVNFSARVRGLRFAEGDRVTGLSVGDDVIPVGDEEGVIAAVPPGRAADLVPGLAVPGETRPIVNIHFRLGDEQAACSGPPIIGIVGGTAQWVFRRGPLASVTISAADALVDWPAEKIAEAAWVDVAGALGCPGASMPVYRVVKEKRATIAQTVEMDRLRPGPETDWINLWLAGDWTDTGLPATIEGAVRSGFRAAGLAARV